MKRYLILAALFSQSVLAAPFLEADVVAGVVTCGVVIDGGAKVFVGAASLKCRYDLAGVSNGSHTATMTALTANDPVYGTLESVPSSPFVFVVPAKPSAPANLRLAP